MYANLSSELYFGIVINEWDRFLHTLKARSCSLLSVCASAKEKLHWVSHTFYCRLTGKRVSQDKIHNLVCACVRTITFPVFTNDMLTPYITIIYTKAEKVCHYRL